MSKTIHVVAGVITNSNDDVLLALRDAQAHQGGLWEFSGGKKEADETVEQALQRELHEELDITVQQARPLIRISHAYPDKTILLDVWKVERWTGQPKGKEGQPIAWCPKSELHQRQFPAANYPIINAAKLPDTYLITPEPPKWNDKTFFYQLERCLDQPIQLVQLRAKHLSDKEYCYCAEKALNLCERYQAQLLMNTSAEMALSVGTHGVHLDSKRLYEYSERPLPNGSLWVAASCHYAQDLQQAQTIKANFAVLSPVKLTQSHPDVKPLGWSAFWELTESAQLPIYALGGMQTVDIPITWAHGGQGIASIRGLWSQ
ncbi:Nudix family hydrolase [Candidatus Albibeggiatoa sp. nov. NOAA]|uniref:Nudix family hydrolase n=1 Tax=Candidatus Albibeggiatoa sp. nov. NOAA TaxID=3162724 RepID=UPI0032F698B8|nr:Nudix family hydrolase [Thiotrichaceae bacterium]